VTNEHHKPEPIRPVLRPSVETETALQAALGRYLAEVSARIGSRKTATPSRAVRHLTAVPEYEEIRRQFAECEASDGWKFLLSAWEHLVDESGWLFDSRRHVLGLSSLLATWLRRSGAYTQIAAGRISPVPTLAVRLIADTRRVSRERRIVCILTITPQYPFDNKDIRLEDSWGFPVAIMFPKGRVGLGLFELWSQPDPQELEEFFECSSNALFFPDSVTSVHDTIGARLLLKSEAQPVLGIPYSEWVKVKHKGQTSTPGGMRLNSPPLELLIAEANRTYSYLHESGWLPFPSWTEAMLGPLLLWGWTVNSRNGRQEIPIVLDFVLDWPGDPFELPPSARLVSEAAMHLAWCDGHQGDETDDCGLSVSFSESEASEFKEFMLDVSDNVGRIRRIPKWWGSIENGLQLLIKSWISQHDVEKFFWSVVALESLLGAKPSPKDPTSGIRRRIGERLIVLCGKELQLSMPEDVVHEYQDIAKLFRRAYDVRSNLVHGSGFDRAEFERLRFLVFALARGAAKRVVLLLGELAYEFAGRADRDIPRRDTILRAIDTLHHKQESESDPLAQRIRTILQAKPFHWPCEQPTI